MIEPLSDELARLLSAERTLPAADRARQAAVRTRVWKTLGLAGAAPPPASGLLGTGAAILAVVGIGAALLIAHHWRLTATAGTLPAQSRKDAPSVTLPGAASRLPLLSSRPSSTSEAAATEPVTDWMGQPDVAPRVIDGTVTLDGKPLRGADVTLASPSTGPGGAPLLRVATGADGRFEFPPQPAWTYTVVAEHAGLTAATARVDLRRPAAGHDVTLALTACATRVTGTVADADAGTIAGARVVSLVSPWHGASTTSDASGHYTLCVPTGTVRLRFIADGYGTTDHALDVPFAGARLDVGLTVEHVVTGVVIAPNGAPCAGAQVNLWHDPKSVNLADAHAVTDSNGRFEIAGLTAGHFAVNAWRRGAVSWPRYEVTVGDIATDSVVVKLAATAEIRGSVVRDGRPVAGADVVASRGGDVRSIHAITQEDGTFALDQVPIGDEQILVDGRKIASVNANHDGISGLVLEVTEEHAP